LHTIDLLSIIFIFIGYYRGWHQGFFTSLVTSIVTVAAALVVVHGLQKPGELLHTFDWLNYLNQVGPYGTFIALSSLIILTNVITAKVCHGLIGSDSASTIDKFLGSIAGVIRWTLVISAFVRMGELLALQEIIEASNGSWLTVHIQPILPYCTAWVEKIRPVLQSLARKPT
jgi:membrane protein required for colicin V production